MRENDKYMMRAKQLPYYFEDVLVRTPVGLKIYEYFDGKEVRWGVREEYISIFDDKLCKSTPCFENMTNENGKDLERVIYFYLTNNTLSGAKFVFHGKLNGSEVLCRLNDESISEEDFYQLEDFGGKDVNITEFDNKTAFVKYKEDGYDRCVFFDYGSFKPCSNVFDIIMDNNFFVKSYVFKNTKISIQPLPDTVRRFAGLISEDGREVKEYGFDIDQQRIIKFPLNLDGQIDEEKMWNYVKKTKADESSVKAYEEMMNFLRQGIGLKCRDDLIKKNGEKTKKKSL